MAKKTSKNHYFDKDGNKLLGVTSIIGNVISQGKHFGLMYWGCGLAEQGISWKDVMNDRARIGTLAHHMIEQDIADDFYDTEGYTDKEIEIAKMCYELFSTWAREQEDFTVVASEMYMVSEKHGFGGTCDLLYRKGGQLILADYKTSKKCYEEHKVQQCAYKVLVEETLGYKIDAIELLRINEDLQVLEVNRVPNEMIPLYTKKFFLCHEIGKLDVEILKMEKQCQKK